MDQVTGALASGNPEAIFQFVTANGGVGAIGPDGTASVTEDLKPGQYMLLCFIPSPADGLPHAAKGMVKQVTVTAPAAGASAVASPSAGSAITMKDFAFDGATTFNAGNVTIKVDNSGPQIHEMNILKLAQGKTAQDVLGFLHAMEAAVPAVGANASAGPSGASINISAKPAAGAPSGPPPFSAAGGINGFSQGLGGWANVNFTPGDYVFICNVPDPNSGKAHYDLGMIKAFSVK